MFATSIHLYLGLIIVGKARSLPDLSTLGGSPLMVGSQPCPQILAKGESELHINYYIMAKITAIKNFIVQAPDVSI